MTHLSGAMERSIGEVYLNGDMTFASNPIAYGFGVTQATNSGYLYVSLRTSFSADGAGNEVTTTEYPGYARVAVRREKSFASPGASKWTWGTTSFTNLEAINFPPCGTGASGTIIGWGIYDAATGGNEMFHGPLVASGATFKVGYHTGEDASNNPDATFVFSRAHGLSDSDTIRMYQVYDGNLGSGSFATGGTNGALATVSGVTADTFQISGSFATVGAVMFIKSSSISLAAGKIPSIPAGGMTITFA